MPSPTPDLFDATPLPSGQPARLSLVPEASPAAVGRAAHELWLCLWLPGLPLDALVRGEEAGDTPACVVEGEGSAQRVVAANDAAARHGIQAGLGLNAALALCPDVRLHARQPAAEAALLEKLARWATQFTPVVSLEPPQALLAEVRGSLGLFGGTAGLRQRALEDLSSHGLNAVAALAPTPRAALWLARAGIQAPVEVPGELPGLATRLPMACLGWPQATLATLSTLGVRTVADLSRLPRDGFARRFGPSLLAELDEAFGRRPQPRRRAVMPERFDDALELPAETGSVRLIEFALERLLGRLQTFLRARSAGIHGLTVALRHRGQPATRLRLGLARPSGEAGHLLALLHERLGRTPLPAPVVALRLRSTVAVPLELRSRALPGTAEHRADPEAAARLLEHLRARFGRDAVFSVRLVPEHRPERAWQVSEPSLSRKGTLSFSEEEKGGVPFLSARPLWMLAEPQALPGRGGLPLAGSDVLTLISGPERIETGWWDGEDVRRDYYVAAGADGVRLWIYRERRRGGGWWLHGVFG
jgi:protein ImuB